MSVMRCAECQEPVDTDEDMNGLWGDTNYTCESCTEKLADEPCEFVLDDVGLDPECDCLSCSARKVLA